MDHESFIALSPDNHFSIDTAGNCDNLAPAVVLRDVRSRPRPGAHVIVFANEKGGVGKSTLAFHCCVALGECGANVLAIDLDRRQKSLSDALECRMGMARTLNVPLPSAKHVVLDKQSGALLDQEILRLGAGADFVVIDVAGHDSPIARYAISIANTLVTPINSSTFDLNVLGKLNPVTKRYCGPGHFGQMVAELRDQRLKSGLPAFDWIVIKNRLRKSERRQELHTNNALRQISASLGFRIGQGLSERLGYRDLLSYGLTYLDLKRLPSLGKRQLAVEDGITRLILDLNLPLAGSRVISRTHQRANNQASAYIPKKIGIAINESIQQHFNSGS